MKMKKFFIKPTTCFKMGIIGSAFGIITSALMIFSFGPAFALLAVQFVFTGGLLLFLASSEKGDSKKKLRIKIVILFTMLLFSYFNLPILCPILEMLVVPFLYLIYRKIYNLNWHIVILGFAAELCYAIIKTLKYSSLLGQYQLMCEGFALLAVSLVRFFIFYILYKGAIEYISKNFTEYEVKPKNPLRR